jgi:anti-sigma B factor antagonist
MQEAYPYFPSYDPAGCVNGVEADGAVVVRLVGEFDSYSERLFLACIGELLSEGHTEVRFDFSDVRFVDTCGLRCLFQAQRHFRRAGRQLVLTGLPEGLERILLLVGSRALVRAVEDLEGPFGEPSNSVSA